MTVSFRYSSPFFYWQTLQFFSHNHTIENFKLCVKILTFFLNIEQNIIKKIAVNNLPIKTKKKEPQQAATLSFKQEIW